MELPQVATRLLIAIAERTGTPGGAVRYEPAVWLRAAPTDRRRQQWSRWTRRLADAGLLERLTQPLRDRVSHVRLTPAGHAWLTERGASRGPNFELQPLELPFDSTDDSMELLWNGLMLPA